MVNQNSINTNFTVGTEQAIVQPTQPAFFAFAGSSQLDVTGNNTIYNVRFDTEVFDQNADYDGDYIFYAPVTGKYSFICTLKMSGITAAMNVGKAVCKSTSVSADYCYSNAGCVRDAGNFRTFYGSIIIPMDAGDNSRCRIQIGGGLKVADVMGDASISYTNFGGMLEC